MATLERVDDAHLISLRTRNVMGRSVAADVFIDHPQVSNEHAAIWWDGEGWRVRDLASRNGTSVAGKTLKVREARRLRRGDVILVGSEKHAYRLTDNGAPTASAVSQLHGHDILPTGDILALPDELDPVMTVYRDISGKWVGERSEGVEPLRDLQLLRFQTDAFRIYLPVPSEETVRHKPAATIDSIGLQFTHSLDEEHVVVAAIRPHSDPLNLGARAHNYLLLLLARQRLQDADEGGPIDGHGWLYREELARMLGTDERTLNVHIYRARQALATVGVEDAALLIEVRTSNRQVRIGVSQLVVKQA